MNRTSNLKARIATLIDLMMRVNTVEGSDLRSSVLKSVFKGDPYAGFDHQMILEYDGKRFVVSREGGLGIVSVKNFEPACFNFMKKLHGGVFVDVGANVGAYVIHFASEFERVLAVEPNPKALNLLKQNLRMNGLTNVEVVERAVRSEGGSAKLYGAESLVNWNLSRESDSFVVVETTSLDELLSGFERVKVLLIDVEGQELDVIQSGQNSLGKIDHVIVEVRKRFEESMKQLMAAHGFRSKTLEDRGPEKNILYWATHGGRVVPG